MSIQSELLALKNDDDLIVAETVVDWARKNPDSEIHGQLEWSDRKAADQFRLWQVRRLVAIHVVDTTGVRQVVSLSVDRSRPGGGYRELTDVLSSKDFHEILLEDALK